MAASTLTRDRLRRLAEFHPSNGRVLSVYLNLDPSQFATGAARATAITSLMNEAAHAVEEGDFGHDEHQALRQDLDRVRGVLEGAEIAQGGTKAVAIFACGPAEVLEVVHLSNPVDSRAVVHDTPFVEPLVTLGEAERWAVLLTNRRSARILLGDAEGFKEVARVDDDVKGQHQQGGWSQARYQRSIEEDKRNHLQEVAEEVFRTLKAQPFEYLLIGAPDELANEVEEGAAPVRPRAALRADPHRRREHRAQRRARRRGARHRGASARPRARAAGPLRPGGRPRRARRHRARRDAERAQRAARRGAPHRGRLPGGRGHRDQ
jgi:peptide subunit release factor 1 (eRF1)